MLADREKVAADRLIAAGVMVDPPFVGHPRSDVYDCWSVCVGSHGGHAKRLAAAMRRCLKCCGIGKWWQADHGKGELLRDLFARVIADMKAR